MAHMELNEFADWTKEEIEQLIDGSDDFRLKNKEYLDNLQNDVEYLTSDEASSSGHPVVREALYGIDWRNYDGVVTDVRKQGKCGSCWAHSAVAVLEGSYAILNNKTVELSEQ
jgi:C1A family cysteine protease